MGAEERVSVIAVANQWLVELSWVAVFIYERLGRERRHFAGAPSRCLGRGEKSALERPLNPVPSEWRQP